MAVQTFEAAPLDSYAERITTGIAFMGGVLMLPALFSFLSGIRFTAVVIAVALALALAVFLLLNYAFQPTRYEISDSEVVIRRRLVRRMKIPFKEIAGVSSAGVLADVPRFGLRRAFNAGVFGYGGPFQLEDYGRVFFIATNRERLIAMARYTSSPLVISPARPQQFIDALREVLGRQQPENS